MPSRDWDKLRRLDRLKKPESGPLRRIKIWGNPKSKPFKPGMYEGLHPDVVRQQVGTNPSKFIP